MHLTGQEINMKKLIMLIFAGFTLGACASASYPATAAEKPNILIFGEDHSNGTFPRDSRVFRAVLSAIRAQLNTAGYDTYDETWVTNKNFTQGRINRSDAEIADIAKSVDQVPIDVAVVFHLYGQRHVSDWVAKVKPRIMAKAIIVHSGLVLDEINRSLPQRNLPRTCKGSCLQEEFVDPATDLAFGVGKELSTKISHIVGRLTDDGSNLPTRYVLVFDGFESEDLRDIQTYIAAFSGYKDHRPVRMTPKKKIFYYNTQSKSGKLYNNLERMLEHLGLRGNVNFSGNKFIIEYISVRRN